MDLPGLLKIIFHVLFFIIYDFFFHKKNKKKDKRSHFMLYANPATENTVVIAN